MGFETPALLWLICLPIVVAIASAVRNRHGVQRSWVLPLERWGAGVGAGAGFLWVLARRLSDALFFVSWSLLCVVAAGPSGFLDAHADSRADLDVVFVLDVSPSMAAMDMEPNRLQAAQAFVSSYVRDRRAGGSVGLVAFGGTAALLCPVSDDAPSVSERLFALAPGMLGDGTAIGQGLALAARHLARTAGRRKALVLITDGEDTVGLVDPLDAASTVKRMGVFFALIGMGTTGDVPFRYEDPVSGELLSGTYRSAYDERVLEKLAAAGGGSFLATRDVRSLSRALDSFDQSLASSASSEQARHGLGPGLSIAALVSAALAFFIRRMVLGGIA